MISARLLEEVPAEFDEEPDEVRERVLERLARLRVNMDLALRENNTDYYAHAMKERLRIMGGSYGT